MHPGIFLHISRSLVKDRMSTSNVPSDSPLRAIRLRGRLWLNRIAQRPDNYLAAAVCALLLLGVLVVFGQTLRHGFLACDDDDYVYKNLIVRSGLTGQGFVWAFTSSHAANWHPLTWLSHMTDCQVFGSWAGGHHLTNVLLHAATAILLFLALWWMTGRLWPCALVAALFALHPLRAESVAWVAERKDVLSGLFFMLTLVAYVGYTRHPFSWVRYLLVVALFALGLMAKPAVVTLPFVLLLLDYWPLRRMGLATAGDARPSQPSKLGKNRTAATDLRRNAGSRAEPTSFWALVIEKIPLLVLALVSCVLTCVAQNASGAFAPLSRLPILPRITNALVAYVTYVGNLVYPVGLGFFYPHPQDGLPIWKVLGALALLTVVTLAAIRWRRQCPYFLVGWLWYLGMLVPMIGLVQVGEHAMADRYTYLAQIGLLIAGVWGIAQLVAARPWHRWVCAGASLLVVLGLMAGGWQQTSYWRDDLSIWAQTEACTTQNPVAEYNLGMALANRRQTDEAIVHYQKALAIWPDFVKAHNNLGVAYLNAKRFNEAVAEYEKALQLNPRYASACNNLGAVLQQSGKTEEAIAKFRKAIELDPRLADAYENLGSVLAHTNRLDEAAAQFQKALEIEPDSPSVHYRLGTVLFRQHKIPEALDQLRMTIRLQPMRLDLANELAWILATYPDAKIRNGEEAVMLARWMDHVSGGSEPAFLGTLAAAYAEAGQFPEAIDAAERAIAAASSRNDTALVDSLRARLKLYRANTPYHETADQPKK
jgi:protein O-mannosyl-transferase